MVGLAKSLTSDHRLASQALALRIPRQSGYLAGAVVGLRFGQVRLNSTKVAADKDEKSKEPQRPTDEAMKQPGDIESKMPDVAEKTREDVKGEPEASEGALATGGAVIQKPKEEPKEPLGKRVWAKVKHEAQHYWDGTKLLAYEVRVSTGLALKMAAGHQLTRRESRQLRRTTQDIVRLVPFSMFVIIPFAELLLPVALKLFPNMLPSTYESGSQREAKLKKLRTIRGKVSSFLRQTLDESSLSLPKNTTLEEAEMFVRFFKEIRKDGVRPSNELIVKVARMFKDDVVLDNLSRPQLVAMAKYMNLQPFGTNLMLRYSIRHRMKRIKLDDRAIDYEGIESLSIPELQHACASRGIRTHGISPGKLREDLATWLELRLHQKVPSTLLLLSSAYSYGVNEEKLHSYYDGILSVLSGIPEELFHEAELEVASATATNKQRLEVFKEQQELIRDENREEEASGHVIKVNDNLSLEDDEHQTKLPDGESESESESETSSEAQPSEQTSESAEPDAQQKKDQNKTKNE